MQRRCAEPRRQHRLRCFSPWRASSTGRECGSGADQTARTAAPATRCNDVARIGQFRVFAGSMNFGTTPRGGFMGKREPQTIRLELGCEGNSPPNQAVGTKAGFSFRAISWRSQSRTTAGCSPTCRRGSGRRSSRCGTISIPSRWLMLTARAEYRAAAEATITGACRRATSGSGNE
jgi:hypothetical protein